MLEERGLGGISLRSIASAAGVSHGAPRRHFPTYDALLAAIARRALEEPGRRDRPRPRRRRPRGRRPRLPGLRAAPPRGSSH
ncbi:helix-turn-helix transcriptional regulator [Nocardioides sp. W3-2-3]|nr:helix-turn-helix transcriptional regulator [Nocardioides convexus]